MRKTYGNTWWGKQWLNALADIDYSNRLPRGRSYANRGLAKEIVIKGNRISAKVQGTRPLPYQVKFTVPKFSANEKAGIIEIVTSNPLYLSKLLNRDLPIGLHDSCLQKGFNLFPRTWDDLQGSCSCPDWAVPCKHMASVLYLVANEIDKNPFLVFQLHDFDLFKGLEGIGYTAEGQKEIPIRHFDDLKEPFQGLATPNAWDDEVYQQLDFSQIPDCRENLLAILSANPVFYPRGDFKKILDQGYKKVSKNLLKQKKEEEKISTTAIDEIEEVEILLDEELDFLTITFRNSKGKRVRFYDQLAELVAWLEQISASDFALYSPAVKTLGLTYQFARKLAIQSAIIPQLLRIGIKHYKIRWLPALLNSVVRSLFDGIQSIAKNDLLFYRHGKELYQPVEYDKTLMLLSLFLHHLVKTNHEMEYRFAEQEMGHLFFNGALLSFNTYENREYPVAIQLWLHKFFMVEKDFVPVIQVQEEEGQGFRVNVSVQEKSKGLKTPISLQEILEEQEYLELRIGVLRDLAMLSDYFPQINELVAKKGTEDLFFDSEEFVAILFKILPTIRLFGIKVLLPKSLRKLMRPQLSVQISSEDDGAVGNKKSLVNMDELLSFQWQIALGDQLVSAAEFYKMVEEYSGIVKLNDQYIFFDEKEIQALIKKLENPPKLNANQLLHIALSEDYEGAQVALDKQTRKLIKSLLNGENTTPPQGLKATLRPYQKRGYEWLYKNARIGFGSLIADDMGLGKTLQVIATLLRLKEDGELGPQKALIIVPTTLLTNWQKEIEKFAPALRAFIYHGPKRSLAPLPEADVVLTTYGVVRSEAASLQKKKWLLLAIDEAQNIKNPSTAQTKSVKKIKAPIKIAMSGTPVENRLSEYWSIFDFTNQGYLQTLAKFKENFAKPIEIDRDQAQLQKFRQITEPFILRRLKSDKSIIKDLPEKIEKDQFCMLSPEQSALYQNVVDTTLQNVEQATGITRKGLVLKLISALKQVCNHPRHFLKKGKADPSLSGKTVLLFDLLRQILQDGEKTLIFTQYQEMGTLLVEMLEAEFGLEVPFLHGGLSRKQRDEMVDAFQHDRATRIFILSLKAGGTGLNLTAASNVIHYDLWWNPAVEAQATDRAYRIGQKRKVMVHRFITQGSFEEKINELLQEKKELANLTVSTGEKWIGDLSDSALRDLVKLD